MTHRVGSALVIYRGATYGKQLDTAAVIQERTLEFEIALMMRDLGWSVGSAASGSTPGAYAIMEAVRGLLAGYQIPGCRKLWPVREKFVERDKQGGVWVYAMTFALATVAVEQPETATEALFVRGVALDKAGVTAVSVAAAPYTFDATGNIQLGNPNVVDLTVTDLTNLRLVEGVDFKLDGADGTVSVIAGGAAAPNETVQIAYSYGERTIAQAGDSQPLN
jgi:hypothetical protein